MKWFVSKDGRTFSYDYKNGYFSLYNCKRLISTFSTSLENIADVVNPIYYDNHLVIFDYEKGIEIICDGVCKFLKLRAIIEAEMFDNLLLSITNKKIYLIDYIHCEIIEKINVSENFEFCRVDDYILFYRVKRNLSYLYNVKSKELICLKGLPILDILILKFKVVKNYIYIFFSQGFGNNQNCGVVKYDICNKTYLQEDFGTSSAIGYQYIDQFNPIIDENIEINDSDYGMLIYSILKKYGLFIAFYFADEDKINALHNSKKIWIKDYFLDYKRIILKYSIIKSENDFFELKNELTLLANQIETES